MSTVFHPLRGVVWFRCCLYIIQVDARVDTKYGALTVELLPYTDIPLDFTLCMFNAIHRENGLYARA